MSLPPTGCSGEKNAYIQPLYSKLDELVSRFENFAEVRILIPTLFSSSLSFANYNSVNGKEGNTLDCTHVSIGAFHFGLSLITQDCFKD